MAHSEARRRGSDFPSPRQQHEQNHEYREQRKGGNESVLASSRQTLVLIFTRRAAELFAHGDWSGTDGTVLVFHDDWRALLLMLRHYR